MPTPTPTATPAPIPTPSPTPTPDPAEATDPSDLDAPNIPIIGNAIPRVRDTLINVVTIPRQRNTLIVILVVVGLLVIAVFAYLIWRRR